MKYVYILLVVIHFLFSCKFEEIKENRGDTVAKVTDYISGYRGGYSLKYKYTVNDTIYEDISGTPLYKCDFDIKFRNKYLPVVYSKINPHKSILIVDPSDYGRWNMEIPDSLEWIKECFPKW